MRLGGIALEMEGEDVFRRIPSPRFIFGDSLCHNSGVIGDAADQKVTVDLLMDFVTVHFVKLDRAALGFIVNASFFDKSIDDILNSSGLGNKDVVAILRQY